MGNRRSSSRTHFSRNCLPIGQTTNEEATRPILFIIQTTTCSIPTKSFDKHTRATNNRLTNSPTGTIVGATNRSSSNIQTFPTQSNGTTRQSSISQSNSNESSNIYATNKWNGPAKRFTSLPSHYCKKHASRTTARTYYRNS